MQSFKRFASSFKVLSGLQESVVFQSDMLLSCMLQIACLNDCASFLTAFAKLADDYEKIPSGHFKQLMSAFEDLLTLLYVH